MLADVGGATANHKVGFAVFIVVFVDRDAVGFGGRFGIGVNRQVFVFDRDQFDRSLSGVFVFSRHGRHRLANETHFALGEERLVFDGLAMGPRRICASDHSNDARQLFGFFGINAFDLGMGLGAKQHLAVKHIRQNEIVAIDYLAGDFFVGVNPRNGFADDGEFRHIFLLETIRSSRSSRQASEVTTVGTGEGFNGLNGA